ncbi:MAG TPA: ATP-binding protein [Thermoanaerobaculia bacterium]|nr:ATP-binding protein [Thermoanaerobaculia bacterium]
MIVISLGVAVALLATVVAAWLVAGEARRESRAAVEGVSVTVPRRSSELPSGIASVKLHDSSGKLLHEAVALPDRPPLYGLAASLLPPEVTCNSVNGGTLCVETTPAPLARRLRPLMVGGTAAAAAAAVLGLLASWALSRSAGRPLYRMAEVVSKAARDHAYSLRVEPAGGDLGRVAASVNELLAQIQEREVVLRRRTLELEAANKELEAFAYSVSHDLRSPLGSIDGFTQALETDYAHLYDETAKEYISWIREGCRHMRDLIDGLLHMTRLARAELDSKPVDLSSIAHSIAGSLQQTNPQRSARFEIRDGVRTVGDERLLRAVLENLMANAWKFTRNKDEARIEFGVRDGACYVRDNGAGFDPSHAAKMFRPFQRLHSSREFEGTGIGLATVQKIIERHGGRAWAEGEVGKGATIYFTTAAESAVRA